MNCIFEELWLCVHRWRSCYAEK